MFQFTVIANEGIFINYRQTTKEVKKNLLAQVKDIAIDSLKEFSSGKGWKTIGDNIRFKMSDNQVTIFPTPKKAELFGWLHRGTQRHFVAPKTASALCWTQDGETRFSRGHFVSGIKATNFFTVTPVMADRINQLIQSMSRA